MTVLISVYSNGHCLPGQTHRQGYGVYSCPAGARSCCVAGVVIQTSTFLNFAFSFTSTEFTSFIFLKNVWPFIISKNIFKVDNDLLRLRQDIFSWNINILLESAIFRDSLKMIIEVHNSTTFRKITLHVNSFLFRKLIVNMFWIFPDFWTFILKYFFIVPLTTFIQNIVIYIVMLQLQAWLPFSRLLGCSWRFVWRCSRGHSGFP